MYGEAGGNYVPQDWEEEEGNDEGWGVEEEEELHHVDLQLAEHCPDYWHVHKLVKYLKVGDETCTLLALVGLKDCDLRQDVAQLALKLSGGTEVLLNILRTSSLKCIVGSLQVLEASCRHPATRAAVYQLGGMQAVQQLLHHREVQVRGLAASVLGRVCRLPSARAVVIKTDGLSALVALVRLDPRSSSGVGGGLTAAGGVVSAAEMVMAAVEAAAQAVWAVSVSAQGREELLRAQVLSTLPLLLQYNSAALQQAVIGTLHQCLVEPVYRERVERAGLTSALMRFLQDQSPRLQCLAAQALARGSKLEATRNRLVQEGGLEVLVRLLLQEAAPFVQGDKCCRRPSQRRGSSVRGETAAKEPRKGSMMDESTHAASSSHNLEVHGVPSQAKVKVEARPSTATEKGAPAGLTLPVSTKERPQPAPGEPFDAVDTKSPEPGTGPVGATDGVEATQGHDAREAALAEEGGALRPGELLEAVTAVLWHVVCTPAHVPKLTALDAVPVLVELLNHPNEKVVSQVAGAVAEVAVSPECCAVVVAGDGVGRLVALLRRTAPHLLLNVTRALRSCARSPEALAALLQQDGLRLLWSHLKSADPRIQASAASAICTCLHQEQSGLAEEVRSLGGGIELLVALLESPSEAVLSAACAAIARIAVDPRNLAIMTDYGAVTCLSRLAVRENNTLRPFLAEAIAACCISRDTGLLFGRAGAVAPLVQYLETSDSQVRRPTCRALHRLSLEPENCATLHQSGAVPLLLEMLSSPDEVVQEAAADCLRNIRLLALRRCKGRGVVPLYSPETV